MRGRLAALRVAALLAAGFVVLRVVYRIVFGGAGGGGVLLLDLPRVPLAGPFSHISLFGEITTGGIAAAAQSALPFAGVVLACGVLSVLIDIRGLLVRGAVAGPVRTVSRALVVAWAAFPGLLESVRRVRIARDLRGERSAAALIVPVLEQTVERAIALGASMEVRGFAAARPVEPDCERPVRIEDATLLIDGRVILEALDLDLAPATLTLLTGATGSGKSTLLHALSGVFQHVMGGEQRGLIEVCGASRTRTQPRETAGFVGVVAQSVRLSFVAGTVHDEIGFALATRGVAPAIVAARVDEVARRLGIEHLVDREVGALSAGEACLVAIGAAIVGNPVLLLVDEPLADLDEAARERVMAVLGALAHEAAVCVVVVEHRADIWGDLPDARLVVRDRHLRDTREPDAEPSASPVGLSTRLPRRPPAESIVVARIRHLRVMHSTVEAVRDAHLDLVAAEVVALRGPNGAGKSSLLHAIARPASRGAVMIDDADAATLRRARRRRAVALVPEASDDLLFATTVEAECRRADRRAGGGVGGWAGRPTADVFARFLGLRALDEVPGMRDQHPRDLSAGQRLCLVLAIQLSAHPSVLLVDEPTRGLDASARALVGDALIVAAESGTAVVVATHDAEFADRVATRTITMSAGVLHAIETTGARS